MQIVDDLTETPSSIPGPAHHITDGDKLAALIASMEADGWTGAPVVVHVDQALTGSHRIRAAAATYTDIPRVEIADLCDAHGIDWAALVDAHDDWYGAGIAVAALLPPAVVAELGMDLH